MQYTKSKGSCFEIVETDVLYCTNNIQNSTCLDTRDVVGIVFVDVVVEVDDLRHTHSLCVLHRPVGAAAAGAAARLRPAREPAGVLVWREGPRAALSRFEGL